MEGGEEEEKVEGELQQQQQQKRTIQQISIVEQGRAYSTGASTAR